MKRTHLLFSTIRMGTPGRLSALATFAVLALGATACGRNTSTDDNRASETRTTSAAMEETAPNGAPEAPSKEAVAPAPLTDEAAHAAKTAENTTADDATKCADQSAASHPKMKSKAAMSYGAGGAGGAGYSASKAKAAPSKELNEAMTEAVSETTTTSATYMSSDTSKGAKTNTSDVGSTSARDGGVYEVAPGHIMYPPMPGPPPGSGDPTSSGSHNIGGTP